MKKKVDLRLKASTLCVFHLSQNVERLDTFFLNYIFYV